MKRQLLLRYGAALLAASVLTPTATPALAAKASAKAAPLASAGSAASSPAGRNMAIVAEVGGDAISSYDLDARMRFIIATARLSNTPDVMEKIRPQVIRVLIDEKLQLREAQKYNISVTQADIDAAVASIEEQRGMPKGTIEQMMASGKVPRDTFMQQIRAQLAWNLLLTRRVRPQVRVSDDEIAQASKQFVASQKLAAPSEIPQELKIAIINLPVDKPSRLQEIKRLADKLVGEVRAGADFEEVARQFSSAIASGGKVEPFWVKLNHLEPNIGRLLATVPAGAVTNPLKSNEGFTIIKVYEVRSKKIAPAPKEVEKETPRVTLVTLREILISVPEDADTAYAEAMLKVGEQIGKNPGNCDDKDVTTLKDREKYNIEVSFRTQPLGELPQAIKIIAENLKTGDISTPFASNEGIRLYMLCNKEEQDAKPPEREQVHRMLMQQKMELEAQKYIRNLRREVFVDIR